MPRRRNGQAENLEIANADCAGIDIGKDTHYVAVDPDRCRCGRSTPSRRTGGDGDIPVVLWGGEGGDGVASVYWIPVFQILDRAGFEVMLAPPAVPQSESHRIARKSGFSRATCGSPEAYPRPYGALAHAEAVLRLVEAGPARPPDPASPPPAGSGPYDVPSAGAVSSSLTNSKRCASASEAARSSSAGS